MERFQVQGMGCGSCVAKITQAVQGRDPAAKVEVDLASGQVDVASELGRPLVRQLIEDLGFDVIEPA